MKSQEKLCGRGSTGAKPLWMCRILTEKKKNLNLGEENQARKCLEIGMSTIYIGQKKDQLTMSVCKGSPDC